MSTAAVQSNGSPPIARSGAERPVLGPWLETQAINVGRHVEALRDFRREEFGPSAAAPTEGHIVAANTLIRSLRERLAAAAGAVRSSVERAAVEPSAEVLARALVAKERGHDWVRAVEKVWDFYLELFGQRQSQYGDWLLACDRIALDCYQDAWVGIDVAKSVPAPPPFSYMRTGFSPATFRRGIPLSKLGRLRNPFPLVELPYHRLVNPWTLGAVLHEVSHNLQSDLDLSDVIPKTTAARLVAAGVPRRVALIYARWNREIFADLSGLLLGGPCVVASLMDVVGRSPPTVYHFNPSGVHPTPYIRTFLSVALLRRMGFDAEASAYARAWSRLYPAPKQGGLPAALLANLHDVCALVVDAMCYRPLPQLGNRCYADVIRFAPKEQLMIEEAAQRMARGTDPGIAPERYMIGAARVALERRLASPDQIQKAFYTELARR